MVSHAGEDVQVQSQTLSSSSAIQLQAQVDENGEQIIKEINVVIGNISNIERSCYPSILTRYLGSGPHCPSSDCYSCCTCNCDGSGICIPIVHKYMYVTSICVHIVQKTGTIISHQRISLIDITEIKTVGRYADAGYCGLGTRVISPSAILMELRPDITK
jgi:hypothetical protein